MRQLVKGFDWKGNIYVALFLYFALAMLLMLLCRVVFLLFNLDFFSGLTAPVLVNIFWGGLRFDLAAMLYVNSLFILLFLVPFDFRFNIRYQTFVKWLYFVTNSIAVGCNVIDFVYFKFTLRRTTADVFKQFENETNLPQLLGSFLVDYWYALLIWILFIVLMIFLYNRIKVVGPQLQHRIAYYTLGVCVVPLAAYGIIGGMRGGFGHSTRPITLSNAGEYVTEAKQVNIVLNTPFALFRTIGKTKVQRVTYFETDEKAAVYFNPVKQYNDSANFKPQNVVVIILESFSKEFVGYFNRDKENGNYKGYTPFLDSLLQHSLSFKHSFANGRKSIDGLPSSVASIPALGVPYFLSPFSGNEINSLGSILKKEGYHTSFFHGAPNGSMGFNAFMNIAGFENYYGMTEYGNNNDFDGIWGIWDDKFFDFYANKLSEFPQPFVSSFFSVSSHHPFEVPKAFKGKFKGGKEPILKCIEYTDYSLKKFFNGVKKEAWFKNTLFVITADHTSSNVLFEETYSAWGAYSVPVIFYKPDNSLAKLDNGISQQIDIMPSVLSYLGYSKPFLAFGRDVFSQEQKPFAFNFNNAYQFFQDEYLLVFDGQKSIALYDFENDKLLKKNLLSERKEIADNMEIQIKAIIQQYNNRLIDNKMVVK